MKIGSTFMPCLLAANFLFAQQVIFKPGTASDFPLATSKTTASLLIDANDDSLVEVSARMFQQDVDLVTGKQLALLTTIPANKYVIIAGTVGKSSFIRSLISAGKISVDGIKNKWEAYQVEVVESPLPGIDKALVIAGSDRRAVSYALLSLSKQMGVSPWYWWADVPVEKKSEVYIRAGRIIDSPLVKYRGLFINDEAPALSNWSREKFGGFNHRFYEKVFELILRLKGNYIWPAMWGNAFYYDDSLNINAADAYGIVVGTSHHEPLMRAHEEWKYYGRGRKWNYDSTEAGLKEYWKGGMERAWNEKIVSVGMRGDGDEPMSRETATALLERIVADQREIITNVTRKPASETPQLWALYKEVQDYYDKGMRVPDDVTLLLCDDNWGNIRRLPAPNAKPRAGGYGMYYHYDYVGGPRNYKWLNTNPLPRIWEQMHLAYKHNVRQIWIVNVGDIKPMEFPVSFWFDYAWNPEKIGPADLTAYTEQWASAQFGNTHAKAIAKLLETYGKINGRKKPEMLNENTYSFNYNEWARVVSEYNAALKQAEEISQQLPPPYHDAYFQLVLHPIKACANLNEMYYSTALNHRAYKAKAQGVNQHADRVKELYIKDSLITREYHAIKSGKWNHMMNQKHIGYRSWQEPRVQTMPMVYYLPTDSTRTGVDSTINDKKAKYPATYAASSFYEHNGSVSMEADHFTRKVNSNGSQWQILPDHGRTGSAITTMPVTATEQSLSTTSPHVEYDFYTYSSGPAKLFAYFSPTYNYYGTPQGLQFAVSVDDGPPQIISINKESKENESGIMYQWVADNIIIKTSGHSIDKPGKHVLKYWMVSPGVVLQKLVLDLGGMKPSYLGPPETRIKKTN